MLYADVDRLFYDLPYPGPGHSPRETSVAEVIIHTVPGKSFFLSQA